MRTLDEFRLLSFEKKCDVVTFEASYLLARREGTFKMFLYDMGGFFVEVMFDTSENKVKGFHAFHEDRWLGPYLETISIAEVLA